MSEDSNDGDDSDKIRAPRYGYEGADVTPRVRFIEDELTRELIEASFKRIGDAERRFSGEFGKLRDTVQKEILVNTKFRVGMVGEDGKDGRVGSLERAVAAIPGHGKWLIAQVVAIIIMAIGFAFALSNRTQAIETKQESTDDKVDQVDNTLDKLDEKVDVLLREQGRRMAAPPVD